MSRRCKKITGGSDYSNNKALESPPTETCDSGESNTLLVDRYKSRLRPRPTRQTDYFRSPSLKRPKEFNSELTSIEETIGKEEQEKSSGNFVHPTKSNILRQSHHSALNKQSAVGANKHQLIKSKSLPASKRSRDDNSGCICAKKQKESVFSKISTAIGKRKHAKVKEVSSKLWYPFIAPSNSSDSEEEDFASFKKVVRSSCASSHNTKKLASKSSKSSFKGSIKDKDNRPSTSSSKGNSSASGSKLFSSKSSRFSFSRFSKTESSSKNTDEVNTEAGCSQQPSDKSQTVTKFRLSSSKQHKSSKSKSSSKTRSEENKPKSRKRYQSPPNHPLYSTRTFTNSSKTGSCASTSRKGRAKSSGGQSRNRDDLGASSEMSREGARSSDESQLPQAAPAASNATDNQQNSSDAAPAPDNNENSNADLGDPDMSRLQALLEARGLPSHFFGALGPRVQQILNRSVASSGASSKSQQLLQGMQASGDESRQLQSAIEMCQLLVMGNEDTLSGFPVKTAVPTLITLLKMEHNFDMMNHACRALTYMMEALPRSSAVVVDAVPVFLEKLQSIQCMDVAEQSLTALEMLSRRHSAAILRANGLSSCLLYLDFFSLPAQRNALAVAANCCSVLSPSNNDSDFDKFYGTSISMLVQKLTHHDKKCVESICLCFARLIDNFRNHPDILQKITSDGLLENLQNLIVVTPPLVGSNTFVMVIRTMCLLCSSCPNLATQLVRNNIAETLRYLLCGNATDSENIELVSRSPQELYEITSLIGELMPRLPLDDPMFSIERLLKQNSKSQSHGSEAVWQWKGDDGVWRSYSKHDNRMIEEAHRSGDHEASVLIHGRVYMLDFNMLQQINEDTGNHRPVRRQKNEKETNDVAVAKSDSVTSVLDARVSLVKDDHAVISQFVRSLFTLLYEVYGSSAGSPAVRHKCLRAVQRMIYYAEPELLRDVLKNLSVSSHIASMLSSSDLKVVVGALQMSMILMKKLPDVFEVYFRRQGVTHQVEQLLDEKHKVVGIDLSSSPPASTPRTNFSDASTPVLEGAPSSTNPSPMDTAPGRLSDILRRKYPPRKGTSKRLSSSSLTPTPENPSSKQTASNKTRLGAPSPSDRVVSPPPLTKAKAFAAALSSFEPTTDTPTGPKTKSGSNSGRSSASSFFYNLNPVRWGRASTSTGTTGPSSSTHSPPSMSSASSQPASLSRENLSLPNLKKNTTSKENREEVKLWIREQAKIFLNKYFAADDVDGGASEGGQSDDQSLLKKLTTISRSLMSCTNLSDASESLRHLSTITSTSDVSSFELQHSGIITSLIIFLTHEDLEETKNTSVRKVKSATSTPPMVTRRRYKMDSRKSITELEKPFSGFEERPPKSASSDETGRFLLDSSTSQVDAAILAESGSETDQNSSSSFHPVTTLLRDDRIRCFLNVFVGLPDTYFSANSISVSELGDVELLHNLIEKLNLCVSQMEQFAVRTHDLPSAPGRGSQALNFFAKHQLKCQLQRHPDCLKGKQWHSGPVRVDPLALVHAIERYLITRGYGAASSDEKGSSDKRDIFMLMDDDDSEDEIEVDDDDDDDDDVHPVTTSGSTTQSSNSSSNRSKHRLELYIGNQKLPYNMTVYQAVKHYSDDQGRCPVFLVSSDRDTDDELLTLSSNNVWNSTHTIFYKLVSDVDIQNPISSANKKGSQKVSPKPHKRNDSLFLHGTVAQLKRPLDRYLSNSISTPSVGADPSKEVLCLMRVLFGLTLHWHNLFAPSSLQSDRELLPKSEFVNSKLSTKAQRQLQDPLMIMTGELPPWLSELAHTCPFVFAFETRQLLFRIVSFDRDRAMQYLYDIGTLPNTNASSSGAPSSSMASDSSQRFVPKIEKKKCVIKRESLLHQAEKVLQDYGNARSLLEVQYEGEVGTGLGPTLEFYTLTSHELQKVDLGLWRSDERSNTIESNRNTEPTSLKKMAKKLSDIVEDEEVEPALRDNTFVHSPVGLYPSPIGRSTKFSAITKIKSKFRFLGKLLAKSTMDCRMVDIPLSIVCYKWLLGKENEITWFDLEQVDPIFSLTFSKLKNVLHQRLKVEREASIDLDEKLSSITMDGCSLDDLGLDFLLPGFPNIELMKNGSKMSLSISNIDKYLSLIAHWTLLEGVRYQLEAMRDGFQSVFSLRNIDYFFPEELDELFCGARYQPWSERELADCCLTDHGYTHDSETVKTLFRVLSQYDVNEQRSFLQFVTGSPHLPVGGLRALHPQLTIVRKSSEEGHSADEYLPSVMTCVNYLKLPDYSSEAVMRQRLAKASREGQKSFLLS